LFSAEQIESGNLDMQTPLDLFKKESFLEASVNYKLNDTNSNTISKGDGKVVLEEKYLTLIVDFGAPMRFSYAEIEGISEFDYRVDLLLASKQTLSLWGLGYQYEDFLFHLFKLRNELLLKYLLMEEALLQAGYEAQFKRLSVNLQILQTGNCEVRLYDNALLVLPQKGEPLRFPYCFISRVTKANYKLVIDNEFEEVLELSMLGEKFDPLGKALSDTINKMMLRTQENIRGLVPNADSSTVHQLANLMKDGRAASRKIIEQLYPSFWRILEKRIENVGLITEYKFLDSFSAKDQVHVGLKRGLMGELTGSYTWIMFALSNPESSKLSNAIAIEAFVVKDKAQESEDEAAEIVKSEAEERDEQNLPERQTDANVGATYFFRLMGRKEYAQAKGEDQTAEMEKFVKNLNRCMIDINFRREPIFLSEEQLQDPKYLQYRFAVEKMPSLKTLRNLFIGRVVHSSPEKWTKDVISLLAFNAKSLDDTEKWRKGDN
jgi:hypothetical protein